MSLKFVRTIERDNHLLGSDVSYYSASLHEYEDTLTGERLRSDCIWASLWVDQDSDRAGMILMLSSRDNVVYPLDTWSSGQSFVFWMQLMEWQRMHPGLKVYLSPVHETDTRWATHPIQEFIDTAWEHSKAVQSKIEVSVSKPFVPFVFRVILESMMTAARIDWRYLESSEKLNARIERGDYKDPTVAALAQSICDLPGTRPNFSQSLFSWWR